MVREIMHDEQFLSQKAEPATLEDFAIAQDLLETLIAHENGCVGMAANMIGVNKRMTVLLSQAILEAYGLESRRTGTSWTGWRTSPLPPCS